MNETLTSLRVYFIIFRVRITIYLPVGAVLKFRSGGMMTGYGFCILGSALQMAGLCLWATSIHTGILTGL